MDDLERELRKRTRQAGLSRRQSQVALLAIQGYSIVNIAARLEVKESTVQTHLKRIYGRLEVSSRAELAYRLLTWRGPS